MKESQYERKRIFYLSHMVNLTPHPVVVRVRLHKGYVDVEIPPSGNVLEVNNREMRSQEDIFTFEHDGKEIHGNVTTRVLKMGNVSADGKSEKLNTYYIVSPSVLLALDAKQIERYDYIAPDTEGAIKDDLGNIIAVTGFVVFRDQLYVDPGKILKIHHYPDNSGLSLKEQARRRDIERECY